MTEREQIRRRLSAQACVLRAQDANEWQGDFPLPEVLARFYQEIGPVDCTISTSGNPFFIPSLRRLWELQAGYRWHGRTGQPIPDWNRNWLVVADQGGDPFILDIGSGEILFDFHGQGKWDPDHYFDDVFQMAACLSCFGDIWNQFGEAVLLEDCSVNPQARIKLIEALTPLLASQDEAAELADTFGW